MKTKEYPDWLVSLKLSKELRDIGFKSKSCFYYSFKESSLFVFSKPENYNKKDNEGKYVTVPTFEQAFSWFRKKGLFHSIHISEDLLHRVKFFEAEIRNKNADIICIISKLTYEKARKALINKLIEVYKKE